MFFSPGMLCGMVLRSTAVLVANNIQEIIEEEVVNKPAVLEASQVSKNQQES